MNFKELADTVIRELDEKQDVELITRIKSYINRGYKELAKAEGLEKTSRKNVTNGFNKPEDLIRIIQVLDSNYKPLNFSYEGQRIRLNYEGEITIVYSYIPDPLINDDDTPETNLANEEYMINYAKWLYNLVEEQEDIAKIYKVEYQNMDIVKNNYKMTTTIDIYGGEFDV